MILLLLFVIMASSRGSGESDDNLVGLDTSRDHSLMADSTDDIFDEFFTESMAEDNQLDSAALYIADQILFGTSDDDDGSTGTWGGSVPGKAPNSCQRCISRKLPPSDQRH